MKITLTFDSMEEMEAYCMSVRNKRVAGESQAEVPTAAKVPETMPNTIPNTMPVSTPAAPVMPPQSMPVQSTASTPYLAAVPTTASVSGQVPSPAVPTAPIPTTAVAPEYSYDQLAIAAAGLVNAGKGAQLHGILQRFGVQAMTELSKERYGEFATALRTEGAII